jgi:hypothetical protein
MKGELGNEPHIVLYIYLKILIAEDMTSLLKNFGELSRGQSVVVVVGHPGLKTTHGIFSKRSTTIDESFADSSDLRHVRVRGCQFTTRKTKSEGSIGGIGKDLREFGYAHGGSL